MRSGRVVLSVFLVVLLGFFASGCGQEKKKAESSQEQSAKASPAEGVLSFSEGIKPIFESKCAPCHITSKAGGLKLTSYAELMAGGEEGKVVMEGDSANSTLIKFVEGVSEPRMPLGRTPLDTADIQKIKDWIDAGAKDN